MKAADRLGTGSSFGNVPRGRSARGRAKAVTQGDVPTYELVRLRLHEVTATPLNPRRNFGSDEELTRFGEELRTAQLAACVAVSRDTYLELWPEHATLIGDAPFVLVNGERRYRSAVHVGLEALDFVVRNDLAASREEFINFLLKENLDREDFDIVERARGVQALVAVCSEENETGAQTRAAGRLGKSKAWVTNQLALLTLPDGIHEKLSSGELPERDARILARHLKANPELDAPQLLAHLSAVREQEAQAKEEERALLHAAKSAAVLTAVNKTTTAPTPSAGPETLTAVNKTTTASNPSPPGSETLTAVNTRPSGSQPARQAPASRTGAAADAEPVPNVGHVPHQAAPSVNGSRAKVLLDELGSTPADQAKAIASVLTGTALEELITELSDHL